MWEKKELSLAQRFKLEKSYPTLCDETAKGGIPGNIEEGESLTIIATALVDKLGKARNNAEFLQNMNAL